MPLFSTTAPKAIGLYPGSRPIGYCFGTWRQGLTTDAAPLNITGVEAAEALTQGNKSQEFNVPSVYGGRAYQQKSLEWTTIITGSPTVSIVLEGANQDIDSLYVTVDTSTAATGETKLVSNFPYRFLRIRCATVTGGTNPTIIAKVAVL